MADRMHLHQKTACIFFAKAPWYFLLNNMSQFRSSSYKIDCFYMLQTSVNQMKWESFKRQIMLWSILFDNKSETDCNSKKKCTILILSRRWKGKERRKVDRMMQILIEWHEKLNLLLFFVFIFFQIYFGIEIVNGVACETREISVWFCIIHCYFEWLSFTPRYDCNLDYWQRENVIYFHYILCVNI